MKLKMAFIGFGKSVNRYHLPYVLLRDQLEVKKIYSRSKKPELEQQYQDANIQFTDNINTILEDKEIKLVSICTPPSTHYEFAKLCLEHGKHVVVEKPFTSSVKETRELLDLANEKGLTIMPFQNRRFDSDFLAVKKILSEGTIGNPVELESHFDYYRPDSPDSLGNYFDGAFYGLGVHLLDQVISLFGRPEKVYYDLRSIRNKNNPEDYFHVELFYQSHKVILKTSHLVQIPYPKFILHGDKGSFIKYGIDRQEACLKEGMKPEDNGFGVEPEDEFGKLSYIDNQGNEVKKIVPSPLGDYGKIYDSLYEVIMNGADKLVSDMELLTVMEILEKGFASENPRVIKL